MSLTSNLVLPSSSNETLAFYVVSGTLPIDSHSYVPRQADQDLLKALLSGEYCFVLNSRQMGKSSLSVRTMAKLQEAGIKTVFLDLTKIGGSNVTPEQWYIGLLSETGRVLGLRKEFLTYWKENQEYSLVQRYFGALHDVALEQFPNRIVLFVDEIDAVKSLSFSTDEFFAAIRECYSRRVQEPEYGRLAFALVGSATASDLIKDTRTTPFNIGKRIELKDFTEQEALPLAEGISRPNAQRLVQRVFYWTHGHPFLTQALCAEIASDARVQTTSDVDTLVANMFFEAKARERNVNLADVSNRILSSYIDPEHKEEHRAAILDLYRQVGNKKHKVIDDETNRLIAVLKLSGITRSVQGALQVRNRIYERVFDCSWIEASMPDAEQWRQRRAYRRGLIRAASISTAGLTVIAIFAGIALRSAIVARHAKEKAIRLEKTANARLSHLYVETGMHLMETGDDAVALAPLAEAMELDTETQDQETPARIALHRIRFAEALARSPHIERLWFAGGSIRWAAYSPDKKWVAAASEDGHAHVWEVASGAELPLVIKHEGTITEAAFSPDGSRLVTCGVDGCARVWDLIRRRLQFTLPAITSDVSREGEHATWSRDGRRIATCGFNLIKVWDVRGTQDGTGKPGKSLADGSEIAPCCMEDKSLAQDTQSAFSADGNSVTFIARGYLAQTLQIPKDNTSVTFALFGKGSESYRKDHDAGRPHDAGGCYVGFHLTYSTDGKHLAIAGAFDGQGTRHGACVFDAQTGRAGELLRHDGNALYVTFSPDGGRVATASEDHTARVWDAFSGKAITPPLRHAGMITHIEFSPDGRRVVTASADGTARVWDAVTGRQIGSPLHHAGAITMAQFGTDSSHVLTAGRDGTVRLWILPSAQSNSVLFSEKQCSFRLQWNDTRLFGTKESYSAAGSYDSRPSAFVCDLATGAPLFSSELVAGYQYQDTLPNADGSRCLTVSYNESPRWQEAQLWDARNGRPLSPVLQANEILINAAGNRLFQRVKNEIWTADAVTGKRLKTLTSRAYGTLGGVEGQGNMVPTPDNRGLLFSDAQNTLQIVDAESGEARTPPMKHEAPVKNALFSPDGRWLFTCTIGNMSRMWKLADSSRVSCTVISRASKEGEMQIYFSPDSHYMITDNLKKTALWTLSGLHPLTPRLLPRMLNRATKNSFGFSPDNEHFFVLNRSTQLYNVHSATLTTPPLNHSAPVTCIAFSPDSQWVISGSEDGSARIWDTRSATPLTPPMPHDSNVVCTVFSADGRMVATGTEGGVVRIWDAATGEALTPPMPISTNVSNRHAVRVLAFTHDGLTLIASSYAGGRFWKLSQASESLPRLQALAQLLSGQRYDAHAGMNPLDSASLRTAWKQYQP